MFIILNSKWNLAKQKPQFLWIGIRWKKSIRMKTYKHSEIFHYDNSEYFILKRQFN